MTDEDETPFTMLKDLASEVLAIMQDAIEQFADTSYDGLDAEDLRERLDSIRDALRTQDRVRKILRHAMDQADDQAVALEAAAEMKRATDEFAQRRGVNPDAPDDDLPL
jgi:hypothetical protein